MIGSAITLLLPLLIKLAELYFSYTKASRERRERFFKWVKKYQTNTPQSAKHLKNETELRDKLNKK